MRIEEVRSGLCARLRARKGEIEEAAITRVYGIADPKETSDPEYMGGLRTAVAAALDYGIAALERSEDRVPPIPTALLSQARLAARNRVSLDTVLRRYFAGYALLGDFLVQEVENDSNLKGQELKRLLRAQATIFDRLLAAVSEEYGREADGRFETAEQRRAKRVERLLAGELIDTSDLAYDFEGCHLGAIASGPGSAEALRELATALDRSLLLVRRREETAHAWLGARRKIDWAGLESFVSKRWPAQIALALGEPSNGLAGWRLTHRQAQAALPIAMRGAESPVRYADVALLASILQDDLLAASLREIYLSPLEGERDGGAVLRETLRAYFATGRNGAAAAALLGTSRQTVTNRLQAAEDRIGRSLMAAGAEIDAALRLEELAPRSTVA